MNEYKVNFFKSNGNKPVREAYRRLEDVLERNRIEVAESTISGGIGQMFIRTKRSESWLRRLIAKQAFDAAIEVHLLRTAEKEVA